MLPSSFTWLLTSLLFFTGCWLEASARYHMGFHRTACSTAVFYSISPHRLTVEQCRRGLPKGGNTRSGIAGGCLPHCLFSLICPHPPAIYSTLQMTHSFPEYLIMITAITVFVRPLSARHCDSQFMYESRIFSSSVSPPGKDLL